MTSSGPCDRSYRFGLSIRNGDIFYNGSAPVNLNGRVSGNGSLRVHVSAGAQSANGAGRLSRDYGRGHWRGSWRVRCLRRVVDGGTAFKSSAALPRTTADGVAGLAGDLRGDDRLSVFERKGKMSVARSSLSKVV